MRVEPAHWENDPAEVDGWCFILAEHLYLYKVPDNRLPRITVSMRGMSLSERVFGWLIDLAAVSGVAALIFGILWLKGLK